MKIERYQYITPHNYVKNPVVAFKHNAGVPSLKNINIGAASDGLIGKIRVRNSKNDECFLDVVKKIIIDGYENYSVINESGNFVGEVILKPQKYTNYDTLYYSSDPSHVFVCNLFNYSNPATPYYKNIEQYKDVGIRLLQIALQRSYETMCNGNIKLVSKNESKEWYKKVIGMTEEFPETTNGPYRFSIHNPNSMILLPEAREHLLNLHGGI